ncbi:hypothetical protein ALQ96_03436 [Pseudomonas syringae pv. atrofaciens]|nr:hypothetical protein [Pseudomonas sp. PvP007]MBP1195019.1 hypothetical protein [Pseudomonas sp. PvP100]RML37853.1 hypothetical protein ALQ96_03436 [Pseudomonas syringae pv. atrofaciens]
MAEFRCKVTVDHLLINHDAGVNWIDLYHSPYINVSRKNIEHLGQGLAALRSKKRSRNDISRAPV